MESHQVAVIEHRKTIRMLARIKSGEVSIEDIVLTEDGWKLVEAAADPEEPAGKIGPVAGKGS